MPACKGSESLGGNHVSHCTQQSFKLTNLAFTVVMPLFAELTQKSCPAQICDMTYL